MLLFAFLVHGGAQQLPKTVLSIPSSYRISDQELRLYRMINEYRHRYDLPPIPLSASLCYVASAHVKDLFFHHPDQEPCNFHSWSDKGPWKAFCYPKDENKKNSVWDKPKEITPYKGKGYEIVYWENSQVDIDSVMNLWKSVNYFNSFLMSTGKWQGTKWEAIGIGIYENYACAWFGQIPDPLGPPLKEGENPPAPAALANDSGKTKPAQKPAVAAAPAIKTDSGKLKPAVNPPTISSADTAKLKATYFIIVRTNVPAKDADKIVKSYVDKGYPAARFLPNEGKGRISVFETASRTEALAKLKEIKTVIRDAWLLKN